MFVWWDTRATIKHWFGIHNMIEHEEWDFTEEVVTLRGTICSKCGIEL